VCHHDAPLHFDGMARWLGSWSDLTGMVVIQEPRQRIWRRLRREFGRVGLMRLADVIAFRVHYRLTTSARDRAWIETALVQLQRRFPSPPKAPSIRVSTPNSQAAQEFIENAQPTFVLALCKNILTARIFKIPTHGTFVLHPGICPEYRNAHGCFWALATNDMAKIGMTVLRIDQGIDTGPVYGYFTTPFDEVNESHILIQHRMTLDNLDSIAGLFRRIHAGDAIPIPTSGRHSRAWGQPWLTQYVKWKREAKERRDAGDRP